MILHPFLEKQTNSVLDVDKNGKVEIGENYNTNKNALDKTMV